MALNSGILLGMAACATPPAPATLSQPMTPAPATAIVAAVREVSIRPADGAAAGANAVLARLRRPSLAAPAAAAEVVFVKQDGNAASLVTPATGLAPGAHVAVISAATTSLVQQN